MPVTLIVSKSSVFNFKGQVPKKAMFTRLSRHIKEILDNKSKASPYEDQYKCE